MRARPGMPAAAGGDVRGRAGYLRGRAIVAAAAAAVGVVVTAGVASAADNADIRGTWHWVTNDHGTLYPQDVTISTEDPSSGALGGTDVGAGQTFSVMGTITGNAFTVTITDLTAPGYVAHCNGMVSGSGSARMWTGTCNDTNGANTVYTATLTSAPQAAGAPTASAGAAVPRAEVTITGGSGSGFWSIAVPGIAVVLVAGAAAAYTVRQMQARRVLQPSVDQLDPPELPGGDDRLSPRA